MSRPISLTVSSGKLQDQLFQPISRLIAPLGYQVIHLETEGQKVLRLYIDYLDSSSKQRIGIEDCVKVSRVLDELLDTMPEIQAVFPAAYDLEVTSPGVDRPLRTSSDSERFAGQEVRIHLYRPLTSEESGNSSYQAKNPKQKNFVGTLVGLENEQVVLSISGFSGKKSMKKKPKDHLGKESGLATDNSEKKERVTIPFSLISKANLEPDFHFEASNERE